MSLARDLRRAARVLREHPRAALTPGFATAVAELLEDDAAMADKRGPQSTEGHSPGAVKIARCLLNDQEEGTPQ